MPLAAARKVASALADAREERGALAVESSEPEFGFSRDGHVESLLPSEQTESHRLIEFLMIAANEAVAGLLEARKLPALFRVHEPPDAPRVERLLAQLASLGVPTPPAPESLTSPAGRRAGQRGRPPRRRGGAPARARPGRVHLARAALVETGPLLAAQPRPLRAALGALLPLHVADPPLPGPRLPSRAAVRDRVRGGHGARLRPRRRGRVVLVARARRDGDRAHRRQRRARVPARAAAVRGGLGPAVRGRGRRASSAPARSSPSTASRGCCAVRRLHGWWQPDELETALVDSESGKRIRLGDPVVVQVEKVDAPRGRVDLVPVEL